MKLYVGNLSYGTTDSGLLELFSQFGEVSDAVVIKNKFNDRSKGFGFVEFVADADANKAIETLDGSEVDGRNIKVNEARPKESGDNNRRFNDR